MSILPTNACMTVASAPGIGTTIALGSVYPITGFVSFAVAGALDGSSYLYSIIDGENVELAYGVYTAATTSFARNTVVVNGVPSTTPINASANALISSQVISIGGAGNKFRNASFGVWQRGTSLTVTTAGAYTADGWIVTPTGASVTAAQAAGRGPTPYSLQITGASGVIDVTVKQRIESSLAGPLTGKLIAVATQIYNNTGASITPTITVKHANAADNWSASTTDVNAASLRICPSGQWTPVGYVFTDTGSAGNGLEITIDFGALGASKSVQIAECDIRAVTVGAPGINLRPPTPGINFLPQTPELLNADGELRLCQRYFTATYGNGIALGTATHNGLVSTSWFNANVNFPVQMRVAPTLNYWDGAGNASKVSLIYGQIGTPVSLGSAAINSGSLSIANVQIQDGDFVVVAVGTGGSTVTVTSISDGVNTYTRAINSTGTTDRLEIWYAENCAPVVGGSITVTTSNSLESTAATACRVPGMTRSGTVLDKTATGTTSASSGTLIQAAEILFGSGEVQSTVIPSDSTFVSISSASIASPSFSIGLQYKIVNATTSVAYTPIATGTTVLETCLASFMQPTIGTFFDNINGGGAVAVNIVTTGFVSGLGLGSKLGQGVYFHYSASAEL